MLSNFLNLRTYTYSANKTKRMSSLLPTCTFIGCCYWNLESESADNLWIPKRTASTDGRSFGWDLLARMQWPRFRGSSADFPTVSTSSTTNAVVNKGRGVGFTSWWWLVMMMLGSVTLYALPRSCHHNKTRAAAREIRLGEYLVEDLTKPPNCLLKWNKILVF